MTQTTADGEQQRGVTPTRTVATLVREARDRRGWTAEQLAERCAAAGMRQLDRSTIANIETGRRRRIGVDEWLVLAHVLDVAPLHLLLPRDDDDQVAVTPTVTVTAAQARRWAAGREPLPGGDERTFRYEVPDSEYERRSQRVRDAEDRNDAAWRRLRVAKEKLKAITDDLSELDRKAPSMLPLQPAHAKKLRLEARLDVAYDQVAEATVEADDAWTSLRRVWAEEGADDGER